MSGMHSPNSLDMKTRILFVIAIIVLSVTALEAQVSFGPVGGPNFQNITGTAYDGDKLDYGMIVGFHAGVKAAIPIAPDFYFQTGLLYSCKGSRNNIGTITTKSTSEDFTTTTRIGYLELPLNLLFRPVFGNGHILLGFGPYMALGITGKQVYDYNNFSYERKVKFKNVVDANDLGEIDIAYYRPFDAGGNIFAGYELDMGLFFTLNAQMGLLKVNPELAGAENDETVFHNTGFGLSVGYNF
jgi:hypothetical protein